MNKNKTLFIIVVILLILVISLGGFIYHNKVLKNNNGAKQTENNKEKIDRDTIKKDNTTNDNSANLDFDFNELANRLHSFVQKDNITTFLCKCNEKTIYENEPPEIECINTIVSNDTIDTIINKLKTAKSVDNMVTYSWLGCPPNSITYYVSVISEDINEVHSKNIFSLNYADAKDLLLVGYNNDGHAFKFNSNEEISNFIESLK
jgi:uncharacterized protein YxeA